MINLEKKCIFCHVEKTGGTSMSVELRTQPGWHYIESDFYKLKEQYTQTGQMPKIELTRFTYYTGIHYPNMHTKMKRYARIFPSNEFFYFGFVRDPLTRYVSLYIQQLKHLLNVFDLPAEKVLGLDRDQLKINVAPEMKWPNIESGEHEFTFDFFLSRYNLHLGGTQVSDLCDDNKQNMLNFTGRFENLNEDWKRVCEKATLEHHRLPKLNSVGDLTREVCEKFYTPDLKEFLFEAYHDEFEVFNYEKR
ncbi:uncharacterized protein METZ01_LOCUS142187 [marine metagenome]|jgi:hypothetical protein|uniref:Sulfotransferase domain-containing protein n=1 Tax=marine metagenome TaxID=408172 RepID=A0A381ZKR1_9ZZZZ|tara:strand:- start:82 stop:828 length:747 start_codon:yes stop_codon:yes gene_type:complete